VKINKCYSINEIKHYRCPITATKKENPLASTDSPKAARACPRRFQASPASGFACIAYARSSQVKLYKRVVY